MRIPSLVCEMAQRACGIAADDPELEHYVRIMEESRDWMMEPVQHPGAFDFGDEGHFQRGVDLFARIVRQRRTRAHPMYVYFNRSIYGFKAMLYRLGAQVDVGEVTRQERPASK